MPNADSAMPITSTHVRPLTGRVALVTGSTSGIGLGILEALAEAGANVVMTGLGDQSSIDLEAKRVSASSGSEVAFFSANLGNPREISALIEAADKRFGHIDILVNNAGIQFVAPIEEFPVEKWDAILALNLSAAFHATRLCFKAMKERKWGRIINIASAHGLVASPFKSAYVAAKHGLVGLTKTTAMEGAEHGVTANAICPGYVWTPLVEKQIDAQAKAHGISRDAVIRDVLLAPQPNKKFAEVSEMGALAVFLCTEGAKSITGTALPVDGGWTAH